ncbi:hypothetical protein JKF63_03153 [Porcisia hertigi]|uniref:Uncharacterized protein n=1 Tax=Porcisia hertigi TaxID=2761500 RepID=A0A836HWL1_9TRYP|nr:hypothetical protein JKF63_03153 [Porcisia hertigi]
MTMQPISIHYQHMEEWLEDRRSVFSRMHGMAYARLLSIAPRLVEVAQYDIPALEKHLKKNETAIKECRRVCEEAQRKQLKLWEKRSALLSEYGMELDATEGANDVASAVDQRVGEACVHINSAFQAYICSHMKTFRDVYNALLGKTAAGYYGTDPFSFHFPWHHRALGEAEYNPAGALSEAIGADGEETDASGPCIDWGDGDDEVAGAPAALPEAVVEVNWDTAEMEVHSGEYDGLPVADGVHFSIDLASARHRVNVIAELEAALCFCRERGSADLMECAKEGESLHSLLSNSKECELARMKENYRTRANFVDRIDRFAEQIVVTQRRSSMHQTKMRDAEDELEKLKTRYDELLSRLRGMRDETLTHLRQMFPEREILILGDLNKYLT